MDGKTKKLARTFKALSDETRLAIMGLVLHHGHLCVCEVERILQITQSKASRHLRYLRNTGLLVDERDGLVVNYRLPQAPDPELTTILGLLPSLLAHSAFPDAGPLLVRLRATRTEEEIVQGNP